jgi:hypothetical protein
MEPVTPPPRRTWCPIGRQGARSAPRFAVALVLAGTAACAGGDRAAAPTSPAVPSSTAPSSTAAPITTAPAPTTATPAPAATTVTVPASTAPSCPAIPARAQPPADRPRYDLTVDVRPAQNEVVGETRVRFTPDRPTDRLVFRLWPNGPRLARAGARLEVGAVAVDGRPVDARIDEATTLVARPGGTLAAGRSMDIVVPWRLNLPGPVNDRISRSGDAVRLGSFFPILAWEPGVGWAVDPPTTGFAEASTVASADFTATITVPAGLDVLATGRPDGAGRWTATAVPDFALSVGRFTMASATVDAPQPVEVTVGVHAGIADQPSAYLRQVAEALVDLSRRYGAYPWSSYSLAITPELSGGIEYPMHVLQGPGTTTRTTPHEVAHMWFYGLVTNNQGRDPWLDEGLASFAEARVENTLASFRARTIPAAGRNRVGEPMSFWESRQSAYYRSVYVQGAQALAALGDADLVDCVLRLYVARTAHRVARPGDLVDAAAAVFPGAEATLARFGIRR